MNEMYSKEAVEEALRLTAMGSVGILGKKDAAESLEKLPESLQGMVVASTVAAFGAKQKVLGKIVGDVLDKLKEGEDPAIQNKVAEMVKSKIADKLKDFPKV